MPALDIFKAFINPGRSQQEKQERASGAKKLRKQSTIRGKDSSSPPSNANHGHEHDRRDVGSQRRQGSQFEHQESLGSGVHDQYRPAYRPEPSLYSSQSKRPHDPGFHTRAPVYPQETQYYEYHDPEPSPTDYGHHYPPPNHPSDYSVGSWAPQGSSYNTPNDSFNSAPSPIEHRAQFIIEPSEHEEDWSPIPDVHRQSSGSSAAQSLHGTFGLGDRQSSMGHRGYDSMASEAGWSRTNAARDQDRSTVYELYEQDPDSSRPVSSYYPPSSPSPQPGHDAASQQHRNIKRLAESTKSTNTVSRDLSERFLNAPTLMIPQPKAPRHPLPQPYQHRDPPPSQAAPSLREQEAASRNGSTYLHHSGSAVPVNPRGQGDHPHALHRNPSDRVVRVKGSAEGSGGHHRDPSEHRRRGSVSNDKGKERQREDRPEGKRREEPAPPKRRASVKEARPFSPEDINPEILERDYGSDDEVYQYIVPNGVDVIFRDANGIEITRVGEFPMEPPPPPGTKRTQNAPMVVVDEHGKVIYQNFGESKNSRRGFKYDGHVMHDERRPSYPDHAHMQGPRSVGSNSSRASTVKTFLIDQKGNQIPIAPSSAGSRESSSKPAPSRQGSRHTIRR